MNGAGFGSLMDGLSAGYSAAGKFKEKSPLAKSPEMTPEAAKSAEAGSTAQGYGGDLSGFSAGKTGSTGATAAAPKPETSAWSTLSGIASGVMGALTNKPALATGIQQPETVAAAEQTGLEGGL